jgi:hypothetical protein
VVPTKKTCPLSYGHTTRLRQLAKHFCRDSIDNLQRRKLGIVIPGLLENGEHLRRQIAASECGSMADLFRYTGLLPDRTSTNGSEGNGNGKHRKPNRFTEFERSLDQSLVFQCALRSKAARLPFSQNRLATKCLSHSSVTPRSAISDARDRATTAQLGPRPKVP